MLILVPQVLVQDAQETITVTFTAGSEEVEVALDFLIQPKVPPIYVNPLYDMNAWLIDGSTKYEP